VGRASQSSLGRETVGGPVAQAGSARSRFPRLTLSTAKGHSPCGWLHCHRSTTERRVTLFCFPHAGGAPGFFQSWGRRLPPWIDIFSIHYPGRETRLQEPLIDDMSTLVGQIVGPLKRFVDGPFALFGHSVGAAIAHEVTRLLEIEHISPLRLFVSGRRGPQHERLTSRYCEDEEKLWIDVCRLGGTPEQLYRNEYVRAVMIPILRNDYRLSETYLPADLRRLLCPVTALTGDEDAEVTQEQAQAWRAVSSREFKLHVFSGGHFYLVRRSAEVLQIITQELESLLFDRDTINAGSMAQG
jgi:pyochelin biosynthesis protein PchC